MVLLLGSYKVLKDGSTLFDQFTPFFFIILESSGVDLCCCCFYFDSLGKRSLSNGFKGKCHPHLMVFQSSILFEQKCCASSPLSTTFTIPTGSINRDPRPATRDLLILTIIACRQSVVETSLSTLLSLDKRTTNLWNRGRSNLYIAAAIPSEQPFLETLS